MIDVILFCLFSLKFKGENCNYMISLDTYTVACTFGDFFLFFYFLFFIQLA